jgi:hypothetical protein
MFIKPVQTIDFDPSNKKHREAVAAFLKRKAWADSPLRFTHDPAYGSVAQQVQTKLLEYYMAKEFGKKTKVNSFKLDNVGPRGVMPAKQAEEYGKALMESMNAQPA